VAQKQVQAAIEELSSPRFAGGNEQLNAAMDAFDARPRREQDACINVFKCMESVAKVVFELPQATFGDVLKEVRKRKVLNINVLEKINELRNREFGHGMTTGFNLSSTEVDFVYLTCIAAVSMLSKIQIE